MQKRKKAPTQEQKDNVDLREQLYNDGKVGKVKISTSVDLITRLNGILLDIDCYNFRSSVFVPDPEIPAGEFFERYVEPWLKRHSVLQKAQVRFSGTGLHVLLMLDKPIELRDELDRKRWAARVQVIQTILPTDPNQPGIYAMTRAIGSINSKTGNQVKLLRPGQGISQQELLDLVDEMCESPVKTVANILAGNTKITPCPICHGSDSSLAALDQVGKCYGCGKVSYGQLMHSVLKPPATIKQKEVDHVAA